MGDQAQVAGYEGKIRFLDFTQLLQLTTPPSTPETAHRLGDPALAFAKPLSVTLKAEHLIPVGPSIDIQKDPEKTKWILHLKGEKAPPSAIACLELRGGQFAFWWIPEFLTWLNTDPVNHGAAVRWSLYNHLLIIGFDDNRSMAYQFFAPSHLRVAIPGKESLEEVLTFREISQSTAVLFDSPKTEDGKWIEYARPHLDFAAESMKPTKPSGWPKDIDMDKRGNLPYLQSKPLAKDASAFGRFDLKCAVNTHKVSDSTTDFTSLLAVSKSNDPEPTLPVPGGKTEEERKINGEKPAFKQNVAKKEKEIKAWKVQQEELPRLQAIVDHASEIKYPLRLVAKPKPGVDQTIVVAGFRPEQK